MKSMDGTAPVIHPGRAFNVTPDLDPPESEDDTPPFNTLPAAVHRRRSSPHRLLQLSYFAAPRHSASEFYELEDFDGGPAHSTESLVTGSNGIQLPLPTN